METAITNVWPTCGTKLTDGLFKSNQLLNEASLRLIKEYIPDAKDCYCTTCSSGLYKRAKDAHETQLSSCRYKLKELINDITIVSIPSPLNWDYEVLGIVTGQSTTGTGIFSEFTSSINDFFGAQSGTYNRKILHGEQLCQVQLRLKCLEAGGNAIVGVDIDYAEVGGKEGMLMVCMTGTAVKLKNPTVLGERIGARLSELSSVIERKSYLESILKV